MAALNADGRVVAINDFATIMGSVNSVSGTGGGATVTVLPLLTTSTISVKGNDCNSADDEKDGNNAAQGLNGQFFGIGDRVTIPGAVTAVAGSGQTAILAVTVYSGTSVLVPAGSVRSVQFNG